MLPLAHSALKGYMGVLELQDRTRKNDKHNASSRREVGMKALQVVNGDVFVNFIVYHKNVLYLCMW
jgi:hypothetical protein